MQHTAKLFMNGGSQAVRLPANYRFDCSEVFIHKNEESGDIIISRKPGSWADYFQMLDTMEIPTGFMRERENELPEERDLF